MILIYLVNANTVKSMVSYYSWAIHYVWPLKIQKYSITPSKKQVIGPFGASRFEKLFILSVSMSGENCIFTDQFSLQKTIDGMCYRQLDSKRESNKTNQVFYEGELPVPTSAFTKSNVWLS